MTHLLDIRSEYRMPKYLQIVNEITGAVRQGKLKKGDPIYSINELSDEFYLSRDTVQKAYIMLRQKGVITSVRGKGFYVNRTDVGTPIRVLLIFNKISNYKRMIYNSFVQTMGSSAVVDLKVHNFDTQLFNKFITDHIYEYDYFVLMPHFNDTADDLNSIIKKIPVEKLIFLDKDIPYTYSKYAGVCQDFKNDIYNALELGLHLLKKYEKLILVFPKSIPYPKEIITGFRSFCSSQKIAYEILSEIDSRIPVNKKEAYIVIEESDLVDLIKICQKNQYIIGEEVGIISYNETPLKEILLGGITVISTDHGKMGELAAKLILENKKEKIKSPFSLIVRKSL